MLGTGGQRACTSHQQRELHRDIGSTLEEEDHHLPPACLSCTSLEGHGEVHLPVLSGLCSVGALMRSQHQLEDFKPQNLNSTANFASAPIAMLILSPTLIPDH